MNILIPVSWLREHLKTPATTEKIAEVLSLTSVSVEKIQKIENDFAFDIEVTTNRPDLMSVVGIAREANAALLVQGIESKFIPIKIDKNLDSTHSFPIDVKNDSNIVNRICAIILDVKTDKSPKFITDRLEASGIRSLNNLVDITNYLMRETGHPAHVFDFDRLNTAELVITRSQKGEEIVTLDEKRYELLGDDIIAKDENGRIVDLLGVMGAENSVVTGKTKKILFFIDNNNPLNIRNTSMNLGIRTEAAVINEKGIDPELALDTLNLGIELYEKYASAKVDSKILDIYPNKRKIVKIKLNKKKINDVIGVSIENSQILKILKLLEFNVEDAGEEYHIEVPSFRGDISIEEDVIEEIARIYGYHNLPSIIPTFISSKEVKYQDSFYFENRIKNAMKYLGFTEVYTYSLVSEVKFEGPVEDAIKIKNPLSIDMMYMRNSLIPGLLSVIDENKNREEIKVFELSNVYLKREKNLPNEVLMFAGIIRKRNASFYEAKGLVEDILADMGINSLIFRKSKTTSLGASVYIDKDYLGEIEILDTDSVNFELNFEVILKFANVKKSFKPFAKFPPVHEDISIIAESNTEDVINLIKGKDPIITDVYLKDSYGESRTFHITYQDYEKNLTKIDVARIREKIIEDLKEKLGAKIRE
jgi:phenylalanyl-tRNA synthetase beta chain